METIAINRDSGRKRNSRGASFLPTPFSTPIQWIYDPQIFLIPTCVLWKRYIYCLKWLKLLFQDIWSRSSNKRMLDNRCFNREWKFSKVKYKFSMANVNTWVASGSGWNEIKQYVPCVYRPRTPTVKLKQTSCSRTRISRALPSVSITRFQCHGMEINTFDTLYINIIV